MIHSLNKGKCGEREWAAWLNHNLNSNARRGRQYSGSPESPDIVDKAMPGIHYEVKRVEKLNLQSAMAQAEKDSGSALPCVAHRRNRGEWLVTLRAQDLKAYCLLVAEHLQHDYSK